MGKDELGRWEKGKYSRCYEMAFVFHSDSRQCEQKLHRRDERPGVLIGEGGTRRPDWSKRVQPADVSAGSDR